MPNEPSHFPITTPSIATPGGYDPRSLLVVDYVVPPRYEDTGAEMLLMRPGDLQPVVPPIHIPKGFMIALIPPEMAAQMQAAVNAKLAQIRAAQERQAREVGARG